MANGDPSTKYVSATNEATRKPDPATSDAKGTLPGNDGQAKAEPSGSTGQNSSTAGSGSTAVHSDTPENAAGQIDPSAPGNTGTTPGSNPQER